MLTDAGSCHEPTAAGSMVWAGGLTASVDLTQEATPAKAFVAVCAVERRNEIRRAMKNIRPSRRATPINKVRALRQLNNNAIERRTEIITNAGTNRNTPRSTIAIDARHQSNQERIYTPINQEVQTPPLFS